MTLTARDIMQTNPITVSPDASLTQADRLFVEEDISGAPVVDDDGKVVGVVSTTDLIRAIPEELDEGTASRPADFQEDEEGRTWWVMGVDLPAPSGNEMDQPPIEVTVEYLDEDRVYELDWGTETCAQANHGC